MRRYLLYVPLDYNTEAYIFYPLPIEMGVE